ncbi:potassium-transporting ATPase potassium-binding subunit [Luteitalea sp. TBR-22]|uniref:potassium-transporting ATPase subunit KdpA n=1 Tax=Luteitalea sp. TBR-22 TaxID=2802971 RepID=UPI001AF950AF|nr:potassium-transporting ATPase subunit KdpA [Luteitalea sp. TBR-22]BCS32221.1 potassium-transporting ATPase potassium-binding subunit [Luteitalea sp. TBR-22]
MSADIVINLATIAAFVLTSVPIGRYIWRVFTDQPTWLDPVLAPVEGMVLRVTGASSAQQDWRAYCMSLLASNLVMWGAAYLLLVMQAALPLNPDGIASMEPTLAFNTAVSFATNTNLQHYSGETGLSTFSQLFVVVWLQFVTAATGIAAGIAVFRGLAGSRLDTLGNFYRDCTRASVRVLLPLALPVALVLAWQGAPVTYRGAVTARTVEGGTQTIARGMVAPEVAIKQLGTNGGGYFGSNSAHPFENPTPLSNLVEAWSIVAIPMAMVWTFGHFVRRRRLAVVLFATMLAIYVPMVVAATLAEGAGSAPLTALGVDASRGSFEGKEVRFGAGLSALWAVTTTVTSNGSVNAMHDSMTPLGGLMPLVGMWLNNVFGGVGVGFINMVLYVVVTVFVAGMMVGRTPEFLGKKVEAREMKLASLALLWHPLAILVTTAIACLVWVQTPGPGAALAWLKNPGPHGFSEMLYEFTSAAANNGSGFEGLGDNTPFWNVATGLVMLCSRYIPIIAPVALVASLAAKPRADESAGSLRADSATFGVMLWGVTIIVGLLMFLPVAVLGPIAEHLSQGVTR